MKPSEVLTSEPVEPQWIVEGIIPQGTFVILAGEAGAGKSFLAYTMAYAVATGVPFLGHPTHKTGVAYFDEENAWPDFAQYNNWIWHGMGKPDLPTLDKNLELAHFSLVDGWMGAMEKILTSRKPGLVIIDTATPAFHIKDENDNGEANATVSRLRRILSAADCKETAVIILKHEKQRDDISHRRSVRGAKSWIGGTDQTLFHVIAPGAKRRKDGLRKTRLEPSKLRAFALRYTIEISPSFTEGEPKGLILKGKPLIDAEGPEEDS